MFVLQRLIVVIALTNVTNNTDRPQRRLLVNEWLVKKDYFGILGVKLPLSFSQLSSSKLFNMHTF